MAKRGLNAGSLPASKKSRIIEEHPCDSIDWFVDVLGTTTLLEAVIDDDHAVVAVSDRTGGHFINMRDKKSRDGLYFKDGHWYFKKHGVVNDSFRLGYQRKGTAHFCQTFATMCYLEQAEQLLAGTSHYADNIRKAIEFWEGVFAEYPGLRDFVLSEIRNSPEYAHRLCAPLDNKPLRRFTYADLKKFMQWCKDHAESLSSCLLT